MGDFISQEVNLEIDANEKEIAAKLRNLRVRACISLDEFAEALGVETNELASYEDGSEHVPASVVAMACALSGISYEYFFGEEISENNESIINTANVTEEQAVLLNQ